MTLPFNLTCLIMALFSIILGGLTMHAIALFRSYGVEQAGMMWSLTLGASVLGRITFWISFRQDLQEKPHPGELVVPHHRFRLHHNKCGHELVCLGSRDLLRPCSRLIRHATATVLRRKIQGWSTSANSSGSLAFARLLGWLWALCFWGRYLMQQNHMRMP